MGHVESQGVWRVLSVVLALLAVLLPSVDGDARAFPLAVRSPADGATSPDQTDLTPSRRSCHCVFTEITGDVDLDGVRDLAIITWHRGGSGRTTEIELRSGDDGSRLFTKPVVLPGHADVVALAPGVGETRLIVVAQDPPVRPPGLYSSAQITGLDRDGNVTWQRDLGLRMDPDVDYLMAWELPTAGGRSVLLAGTRTEIDGKLRVRVDAIDPYTGTTIGTHLLEMGRIWWDVEFAHFEGAFGGPHDILVHVRSDKYTHVYAYSDLRLTFDWKSRILGYTTVQDAGDVVGDDGLELLSPTYSRQRSGSVLLDVRDGLPVAELGRTVEILADDADRDGKRDLIFASSTDAPSNDLLVAHERRGARRIWQASSRFEPAPVRGGESLRSLTERAPDADMDGIGDPTVSVGTYNPGEVDKLVGRERVVLSGATGEPLVRGRDLWPLSVRLDRAGVDALRMRAGDRGVEVTAIDIRTGDALWRRWLGLGKEPLQNPCWWSVESLRSGRKPILMIKVPTESGSKFRVVDGRTGRLRWQMGL